MFSSFPSVPVGKCVDSGLIRLLPLPDPCQLSISPIILPFYAAETAKMKVAEITKKINVICLLLQASEYDAADLFTQAMSYTKYRVTGCEVYGIHSGIISFVFSSFFIPSICPIHTFSSCSRFTIETKN
jgi:hypothetical protein